MRRLTAVALLATGAMAGPALAQPGPLPEGVPAAMPFATPYGETISMAAAKEAVEAAIADAAARGWRMAVAVVSPEGSLIYFARMDDTQWSSSEVAIAKARAAALYRRDINVFANALATSPAVLSLPGVIAGQGGLPIVVGGVIIGGIGCSGAAGPQDAVSCGAGIAAIQ